VHLLAADDAIVRMTRNQKIWEPETRGVWQQLVRGDEIVVDVGAYTGIYSIASALMGAKAVAIEPHPANFRRLKANAAINSVMVDALWMAASDQHTLRMLGANKPADCITDTAWLGEGLTQFPIVTKPIDELRFGAKVCLIKVDVEHHEVQVLGGALRTIWLHKPFIIAETLSGTEASAIADVLGVIGYTETRVLDGRNRLYGYGANVQAV
jgi:FkbM family methyltransferase